jgi:hypothetical protein
MVFPDPGTVVADFVMQAFSRNYRGGCNPVDADIIMTGGISRPGLRESLLKQSLVSG